MIHPFGKGRWAPSAWLNRIHEPKGWPAQRARRGRHVLAEVYPFHLTRRPDLLGNLGNQLTGSATHIEDAVPRLWP